MVYSVTVAAFGYLSTERFNAKSKEEAEERALARAEFSVHVQELPDVSPVTAV